MFVAKVEDKTVFKQGLEKDFVIIEKGELNIVNDLKITSSTNFETKHEGNFRNCKHHT